MALLFENLINGQGVVWKTLIGSDLNAQLKSQGWAAETSLVAVQPPGVSLYDWITNYPALTFLKNYAALNPGEATAARLAADYSGGAATATITASRGASNPATYIDKNGVIQLCTTSDRGRITSGFYDSTGFVSRPGLIVEGASTNLITRTDGTAYAAGLWTGWTNTNGGVAPVGTPTISNPLVPELSAISSATSQRIIYTGVSGDAAATPAITSPNSAVGSILQNYVVSVSFYARSQTGMTGVTFAPYLRVRNSGGSGLTNYPFSDLAPSLTPAFKRFQGTFTVTDATASMANFFFQVGSVAEGDYFDLEFYGLQIEVLPFASTFIPTTTAALTRNIEKISYPVSGNLNSDPSSVFIRFTPYWTASASDGTGKFLYQSEAGTGSTQLRRIASSVNFRHSLDGSVVHDSSGITVTASTSYVATGIKYGAAAGTNGKIYFNGASYGTTTGDYSAVSYGTNLYVGADNGGNNSINGIISSIAIFSDAKSAADVLAISNLMAAG